MKKMRWKREPIVASKTNPDEQKRRRSHVLTLVLSLLTVLALLHFIAVTHSAYPTVVVDTCDKAIRNANYTRYVSMTKAQEMSAVQFTDTLTAGQPSAMVQVVDKSEQNLLDVYLYGCSMRRYHPSLTLLFKQQRLVQGTASLTLAHTLSISQLDTTLASSGNNFLLPLQENVYREYTWQDGALRQTVFPGLYPVVSRSEAEALQEQADTGQDLPWREPVATAEQMAQDLLKWSPKSLHGTLLNEDDEQARVRLVQLQLHMEITVSLAKLVQHDKQGLWFVTHAQTPGITLKQSYPYVATSSPITIEGSLTNNPKGSVRAMLFDHTISTIPIPNNAAMHMQANGVYGGKLPYSDLFPDQPGLLLLQALPPVTTNAHKNTKRKGTAHTSQPVEGQLLLTHILLG